MERERREALVAVTVSLVMEVRRIYLAGGANPLKHWEQLQSRTLAAARTCTTPEEWVTRLARSLQISGLDKAFSRALIDLSRVVGEDAAAWLDLVEREHGYVFARAQLDADDRKKRKYGEEER